MIPAPETPTTEEPPSEEKMSPEETREHQLALMHSFIEKAKTQKMERSTVIRRIYQSKGNGFINSEDALALVIKLDESLGITPEQIRQNKIGFIRAFIRGAKEKMMERGEVISRITQVRTRNFISEADEQMLIDELDSALGITPEQIRKNRIGFIRLFIQEAHAKRMEKNEVIKHIYQIRASEFITDEDQLSLIDELNAVSNE